jgi:hypothetical protein
MTLLSLRDAGASLGLSPNTLRVQINNGILKGSKIGRDWVVTSDEVERYRREVQGKYGNRYGK